MNNNPNEINWRLLVKVAKGQASAREKASFDAWISEAPETNTAIYEEVREIYQDQEKDPEAAADTAAAFARFLQHSNLSPAAIPEDQPLVKRRYSLTALRSAAAVACLLFLSGMAYFFRHELMPGTAASHMAHELKWKVLQAKEGRQIYLSLNDGSRIRLSPGSSLRYPEVFGQKERRVQLEGEAFFEVSKDPSKPFIVQTAQLETRVLGTSFNVEAFKSQPLAKVTVVTGKVAVSKSKSGQQGRLLAYLTPEEQIIFDQRDDSFSVKTITENMTHAIRDGRFLFDGSSMTEIAAAIERRYGMKVQMNGNHIAAMHLTTIIDCTSIDSVAMMLHMATGLEVKRRGNTLYISEQL